MSSPPLTGRYRIKCVNTTTNSVSYSEAISPGSSARWINEALLRNCTSLFEKTEVYLTGEITEGTIGASFYIKFTGVNSDPGQFEIVSDWGSPLVGTNL